MRIYIILAYPNKEGLCYAAFESVKKGLEAAGHEIKTTDLYAENFNPVLVFNEQKHRRNLQYDPEMQAYRDMIVWAEHLVFVFPIWWSGMPAILKGFIDRVFAKGFAYEYKGGISNMNGLLKNKTAWLINTQDAPVIVRFVPFLVHDYGMVLKKQVLLACGFRQVRRFPIFSVRSSTQEQRRKWLQKLYDLGNKL
jgi:NAD(P)H dehydrogenase (quinone)